MYFSYFLQDSRLAASQLYSCICTPVHLNFIFVRLQLHAQLTIGNLLLSSSNLIFVEEVKKNRWEQEIEKWKGLLFST